MIELEDQMCSFVPGLLTSESPDRVDALVWALTDLMLPAGAVARAASVGGYGATPRVRAG